MVLQGEEQKWRNVAQSVLDNGGLVDTISEARGMNVVELGGCVGFLRFVAT